MRGGTLQGISGQSMHMPTHLMGSVLHAEVSATRTLSYCLVGTLLNESLYRLLLYSMGELLIFQFLYAAITCVLGIAMIVVLCKTNILPVLVLECLLLALVVRGIFNSADSALLFDNYVTCATVSILVFCSSYSLQDSESLLYMLRKISPGWTLALCGALMFLHGGMSYSNGTAMVLSYSVLLPLLVTVSDALDAPSPTNVAISAVGIMALFLYGSRGPILSLILLVLHKMIMMGGRKSPKSLRICLILLACSIFIYHETVFQWLTEVLDLQGARYSRTTLFLQEGRLSSLGGREEIWSNYLGYINNHFFLGGGLCAAETQLGINSHNTILELAATAGAPAALVYVCLAAAGYVMTVPRFNTSETQRTALLVFASYAAPFLYIRAYLFMTTGLAIFFGLTLSYLRRYHADRSQFNMQERQL